MGGRRLTTNCRRRSRRCRQPAPSSGRMVVGRDGDVVGSRPAGEWTTGRWGGAGEGQVWVSVEARDPAQLDRPATDGRAVTVGAAHGDPPPRSRTAEASGCRRCRGRSFERRRRARRATRAARHGVTGGRSRPWAVGGGHRLGRGRQPARPVGPAGWSPAGWSSAGWSEAGTVGGRGHRGWTATGTGGTAGTARGGDDRHQTRPRRRAAQMRR